VWGNSANAIRDAYRVAELEAKKSLNDFINKETITSSVSVKMLSKNLEKADDQKKNAFSTNVDPELSESDDELNNQSSNNTAFRNDALNIANRLSTVITSHSRGILGGLYLVEGEPTADGDRVRVTYRWDKKHTEVRLQVRNLMGQ
jgi:hypothetical protein